VCVWRGGGRRAGTSLDMSKPIRCICFVVGLLYRLVVYAEGLQTNIYIFNLSAGTCCLHVSVWQV